MCCIFKYIQAGALHNATVYHESSALFCSLRSDVPGTFSKHEASSEAIVIVIVISKANPLAEINWLRVLTFYIVN